MKLDYQQRMVLRQLVSNRKREIADRHWRVEQSLENMVPITVLEPWLIERKENK